MGLFQRNPSNQEHTIRQNIIRFIMKIKPAKA